MIVGAVTVFGWQFITERALVPQRDIALLNLVRETLEPMNPPGKEITETEIKGLAETIRQLGLILEPAAPRPWLKDLARMTEFNGNPDVLVDQARMLRHFLGVMDRVPVKDRPAVIANIILHAQLRLDWLPFAEMLTKFSVDLMDLSRTGKIPELERAIRVALEKARAEGSLAKATAALDEETRELDSRRQTTENNRGNIKRYIQSTLAADRDLQACAKTYVACQRRLEERR